MTEQEKRGWIKRNIDCYGSEEEAREDLERRLAKADQKASRELKVFKNLDEYNAYADTHNMGKSWDYDSDDFNGEYGDDYEDFVAVCAYEYK